MKEVGLGKNTEGWKIPTPEAEVSWGEQELKGSWGLGEGVFSCFVGESREGKAGGAVELKKVKKENRESRQFSTGQ